MSDWSLDQARKTYSIPHWAEGYFDVDAAGRVVVSPRGTQGPSVPLPQIVDEARANGARLPLLVRFPDILGDRLGKLQAAFAQAQAEWDYAGGYTAVYPIKVNPHRGVAGTLASHHGEGFGLEAGCKPELMAVLALSRPGGLIVCNGYKDREYIRLALIGRKLGLQTFIVIEKPSELALVIEEAKALGVKPGLGVRMRLASLGAGKWQNSGGDKAKFGLSPRQVLDLWKSLRDNGLQDTLGLLHFHMGSQISNVRDIANGMREATRYFVELSKLGATISHVDVGGGLGIDYEGTRSRSYCSINYGLNQYASNIVQPLAEACEQHGLPPPRIVTGAVADFVSRIHRCSQELHAGGVGQGGEFGGINPGQKRSDEHKQDQQLPLAQQQLDDLLYIFVNVHRLVSVTLQKHDLFLTDIYYCIISGLSRCSLLTKAGKKMIISLQKNQSKKIKKRRTAYEKISNPYAPLGTVFQEVYGTVPHCGRSGGRRCPL